MDKNKTYQIPTYILEDVETQFNQIVEPLKNEAAFAWPETPSTPSPDDPRFHNPALGKDFMRIVSVIENAPDPHEVEMEMELQQIIADYNSFHATATEEVLAETALQKAINLTRTTPETFEERLANKERSYSHDIFFKEPFMANPTEENIKLKKEQLARFGVKSQSFWYLDGRFYYEINYGKKGELVLSYHPVANEGVYKAVNGTPAPMLPGEKDSLVAAARLARDAARHNMYPLDDAISDLKDGDGDSLDNLDYLDRLKH